MLLNYLSTQFSFILKLNIMISKVISSNQPEDNSAEASDMPGDYIVALA
jgi:hypothetical protein